MNQKKNPQLIATILKFIIYIRGGRIDYSPSATIKNLASPQFWKKGVLQNTNYKLFVKF